MFNTRFILVVILSVFHLVPKSGWCDDTCAASSINGRDLNGSIDSRRNDSGEWVTSFGAEKTTKGNQTDINMVVNHRYFECQGKTTVKIQGIIKELSIEAMKNTRGDFLRFHRRSGTNAMVTNDGKSLRKIVAEKWDDGVAFTNRPLRDDELFEVLMEERGDQNSHAIGIGVMTHSPETILIPGHMNSMKSGNWMMYITNVYKDGSIIKQNFMKDLKGIKVGEKIGVKRTSTGDLHLLINGVDQGVAASNVPSQVYGVFELYYKVTKVTIIDH